MSLSEQLKFDRKGLVPAIIRQAGTGEVLTLVWMNAEAVERTEQTGMVHYWSRPRRQVRKKGETSGAVQRVREIRLDCDADTLLITVEGAGAACHKGHRSCFHRVWAGGEAHLSDENPESAGIPAEGDILESVYRVVQERRLNPSETSYVATLFHKGLDKILAKVGEEATEAAVAGKGGDPEEVVYEVADLFFHTLVLLAYFDLPPERVYAELHRRFGVSGLAEKASRDK